MNPSLSLPLLCLATLGLAGPAFAADAPVPAAPPTEVVQIDHARVENVFKGGTPGAFLSNSAYKVLASRRVAAPAPAEIHARDTDIFYIVDGTATFLTGGTAVDQTQTGPNEFHAKSITGGTEHNLTKGDVIVVPAGTPHQFLELTNPFLYFVVKVTK
jgi:mannose-6-phosphate isomerase-like protein (cupin superfamily)